MTAMGCRTHAPLANGIGIPIGHEKNKGFGDEFMHRFALLHGDEFEPLDGVAGKVGGNIGRAFTLWTTFGFSTLRTLSKSPTIWQIKHRSHFVDDALQRIGNCGHQNIVLVFSRCQGGRLGPCTAI